MRVVALVLLLAAAAPRAGLAFSVLSHQHIVDRTWDDVLVPALQRRFPGATPDQLAEAKAYAHGGAHVADLGYFPLGSRFFTNLVHYVRSGDFVVALVERAGTLDEYAFALGAVSHWVTDTIGHPEATNRTVPELYPDLREKYGDVVTYGDDRSSHLMTEFRFDVLEVAQNGSSPNILDDALRFGVPQQQLADAFERTYGLRLDDLFVSTDVAITTYRWAFRGLLEETTDIAWQLYRTQITRDDPSMTKDGFRFSQSRADFVRRFGEDFHEPGWFARSIGFVTRLLPRWSTARRMPWEPLPDDAQERFGHVLDAAAQRYVAVVHALEDGRLALPNLDLDTGAPSRGGEYAPADSAYAVLVDHLDAGGWTTMSSALRADILRAFPPGVAPAGLDDDDRLEFDENLARVAESRPSS
jgi:hypothetical protein